MKNSIQKLRGEYIRKYYMVYVISEVADGRSKFRPEPS